MTLQKFDLADKEFDLKKIITLHTFFRKRKFIKIEECLFR